MTKSRKSGPGQSITSQQGRVGKSVFGASRTMLSSASRRNVQLAAQEKAKAEGRPPVQVFLNSYNFIIILSFLSKNINFSVWDIWHEFNFSLDVNFIYGKS